MRRNPFHAKVCIVTGGASGIGRAVCEDLGRCGAIVVVADLDAAASERVADGVRQAGGQACSAAVDVSSSPAVAELVGGVFQEHGRLDFLFNNAGICVLGQLLQTSAADWDRLLDTNLRGVLNGVLAAYPRMATQGFGHIVNTASLAGLVPFSTLAAYGATKHAIVGLSLAMRAEAAAFGVKVSVVCPGVVRTGLQAATKIVGRGPGEKARQRWTGGMEAADCARRVLRGVARNQALIVMPRSARLLWWIYRLFPGSFLRRLERRIRR